MAVTGQEREGAVVAQVIEGMTQPAENLCGRLSLGGLAGLYARSSLVVSNDTGPLHLAQAVGAATVGIFWAYNFVGYGPLTRARHRAAVSWRQERRLCRPDCGDPYCEQCEPFVADISVDEVCSLALDLFAVCRGAEKATRDTLPVRLHR